MREPMMIAVDLLRDVAWEGVVSIERVPTGVQPWRIPHERTSLYPGGDLVERAKMPAGVRLRFTSTTRRLVVELAASADASPVDVVSGGRVTRRVLGSGPIEVDVQPGPMEIWLPQFGEVVVREVRIERGSECAPSRPDRPRWIAHGSSITQCRSASGPTDTWPTRCARELDLDLLCLGYGGQCLLDPFVARMIRDEPADLITLCLGINVFGAATHSHRSLLPAILGFIATIRDGHPGAPVQVITPIGTANPPDGANIHGLSLPDVRVAVSRAVDLLRADGDDGLHLVDGPTLLCGEDARLLADNVHPNNDGYRQIADRMLPLVKRLVPASPRTQEEGSP